MNNTQEDKFKMLSFLVERINKLEPKNEDSLEILSIFRELRWAVEQAYESIMNEKYPKENN